MECRSRPVIDIDARQGPISSSLWIRGRGVASFTGSRSPLLRDSGRWAVDDFRILVSVPAGTPFSIRPFDELDGYTWAWSSVRPREGSEMAVPTDPGPRVFFLRISLRNGTEFDVAFGVDVQGVVREASPW